MPITVRQPRHPAETSRGHDKFGISPGYLVGQSFQAAHLDVVQQVGARWVRVDFDWNAIEPTTQGTFTWTNTDTLMNACRDRGLKVLGVILIHTPTWARTGGTTATLPTDPFNLATFIVACQARFPWIKHWEIGNEMNIQSNMSVPNVAAYGSPASTFPTGTAYGRLMHAVYPRMKVQDPDCTIIACGMAAADTDATNNSDLEFYHQFYTEHGGGYCDAIGAHAYNTTQRPGEVYSLNSVSTFQNWTPWARISGYAAGGAGAQAGATNPVGPAVYNRTTKGGTPAANMFTSLRQVMTIHGDAHKKVWFTEVGASVSTGGSGVTQAEQVEDVKRAFAFAQSYEWCGPLFWYSAKDLGTDLTVYENGFGLVAFAGANKSAYATYQGLAAAAAR